MLRKRSSSSVEVTSIERDRLLRELKGVAEQIGSNDPTVREVRLYGSLTTGNFTPHSDLDLLILVSTSEQGFLQRSDAYRDYFLHLPLDTDIKVYTLREIEEMRKKDNPFLREMEQKSRLIYSRSPYSHFPT